MPDKQSSKGGHVLTAEDRVKGGKQSKHGVHAMENNPLAEWPHDDRQLALKVAEELETRENVELHVRLLAGRGYAMLEAVSAYIEKHLKDDVQIDEIPIFARWPALYNSYARALKMALEIAKDQGNGAKNVTDLLDELSGGSDEA